jgi:HEAT repeat protein
VLTGYADDKDVAARKAALLATVYLAGHPEGRDAIPLLLSKLNDASEDLDVRMAAATALGPLASPDDATVIDALQSAMRNSNEYNAELEWCSALSLAQLGQADVAPTILKLLSREELSQLKYYDRESDPKSPSFRTLSDLEQQRILINTMIGAAKLDVPTVRDKLKWLRDNDPSPRVRAAGRELLAEPWSTTAPSHAGS